MSRRRRDKLRALLPHAVSSIRLHGPEFAWRGTTRPCKFGPLWVLNNPNLFEECSSSICGPRPAKIAGGFTSFYVYVWPNLLSKHHDMGHASLATVHQNACAEQAYAESPRRSRTFLWLLTPFEQDCSLMRQTQLQKFKRRSLVSLPGPHLQGLWSTEGILFRQVFC